MFAIEYKKLCSPDVLVEHRDIEYSGGFLMGRVRKAFKRGRPIWDYLPADVRDSDRVYLVKLNGMEIDDKGLKTVRPRHGDTLVVTSIPGLIEGLIISAIVAVIATTAYYVLENNYFRPKEKQARESGFLGKSYLFDRFQNTTENGTPISLTYGIIRVAGQYIASFTKHTMDEIEAAHILIGACSGPVCSVTDFWIDGVDVETMFGVAAPRFENTQDGGYNFYEGTLPNSTQEEDYLNGTRIYWRRGTKGQGVIPNFDKLDTAVSYNAVLVMNSVVTLLGTAQADILVVKITFTPYGLTKIDNDGFSHGSAFHYRYRVRTTAGPGTWGSWFYNVFERNRRDPFSYFFSHITPTSESYDMQVEKRSGNNDPDRGIFNEAYIKEYQQILNADIRYTSTVLYGAKVIPTDQMTGDIPAMTALVGKHLHRMQSAARFHPLYVTVTGGAESGAGSTWVRTYTSASHNFQTGDHVTVIAAPDYPTAGYLWSQQNAIAYDVDVNDLKVASTYEAANAWSGNGIAMKASRNPASVILDLVYNREDGMGNYFDCYASIEVSGASGAFTPGEIIRGTTGFLGYMKSLSGTTMIIQMQEGFPVHGETLTGVISSDTATVGDINEFYDVDLPSFWDFAQYCNDVVCDGSGVATTVDASSPAGNTLLHVADEAGFDAKGLIIIDRGNAQEETKHILSTGPGAISLESNLAYTHAIGVTVERAEVRCECDINFDGKMPAWDAINRIASNALSAIFTVMGKIFIRPQKAETPVALVSMGNIDMASRAFNVLYRPIGDRPNVASCEFLNRDLDYEEDRILIEDKLAIANGENLMIAKYDCIGVSRASEARRIAIRRIKEDRYGSSIAELELDIDAIAFQAQDVVNLQHNMPGWGQHGGRVISSTASTITLDMAKLIGAGTYVIRIRHDDGTEEEQTITSPTGTLKTLSISPATWTQNPAINELYALGTTAYIQVRVLEIELKEQLKARIKVVRDNALIYDDDIETVPTFEESTLPNPRAMPPDVEDITITELTGVASDGTIKNNVKVSFRKPNAATWAKAKIFWKPTMGASDTYGRPIEELETIGNETLSRPHGVCTDGTFVYFCDTRNNRLVKIDLYDNSLVAALGTYGTGNDNFAYPRGCYTDGTHVWVCDAGNHRIKKHLCTDLSYVSEIGSKGTGNNQFNMPSDIDGDGTSLFIADTNNHRISNFTMASPPVFIQKFGSQGSGDGQFESPLGICCEEAGTNLYVADTGNWRVKKHLLSDLSFVIKVGSRGYDADLFCGPRGIDTNGTHVYVVDGGFPGGGDLTIYARCMARNCSDLSAATIFPGSTSEWGGVKGDGVDDMYFPHDIEIDESTEAIFYFISDTLNGRINRRSTLSVEPGWMESGETYGNTHIIDHPFKRGQALTVTVVSVSPYNIRKATDHAPSASQRIYDEGVAPRDVTEFYWRMNSPSSALLWWVKSTDPVLAGYEIRKGADWETGQVVASNVTGTSLIVGPDQGQGVYYHIKGMNPAGVYSDNAKSALASMSTTASGAVGSNVVTNLNFKS